MIRARVVGRADCDLTCAVCAGLQDWCDPVDRVDYDATGSTPATLLIWVLAKGPFDRFGKMSMTQWRESVSDPVARAAQALQRFAADLPPAARDGDGEWRARGSAVFVLDMPPDTATPKQTSTAIAAASIHAMARVAAQQLAPHCRVNTVAPALRPARLRGDPREAALEPVAPDLPRAPETLGRTLRHLAGSPAVTGQTIFLQLRENQGRNTRDDPGS